MDLVCNIHILLLSIAPVDNKKKGMDKPWNKESRVDCWSHVPHGFDVFDCHWPSWCRQRKVGILYFHFMRRFMLSILSLDLSGRLLKPIRMDIQKWYESLKKKKKEAYIMKPKYNRVKKKAGQSNSFSFMKPTDGYDNFSLCIITHIYVLISINWKNGFIHFSLFPYLSWSA